MKILLIDNGSTLLERLRTLVPGAEVVVSYDAIPDQVAQFDVIVLSGGSQFPLLGNEDKLAREIALVQSATVPIIGICFGHELIIHAFGGEIVHLGLHQKGLVPVEVVQKHPMFSGRKVFSVYENHQYRVRELPPVLEPLAYVGDVVAVLKHKERPVYGFQFHPEHLVE